MSNQNNIPQLRFKEFEGVIKEVKFGKVVSSNIYGPRFNANDYSDFGNVKTIRGTDLGSDGEIKYDQVPLALLDEKMVNTHKLLEGDIVMITTAECGATGVYRKQEIDFLSSAYGVRLRLNEHGYPYYFKYFFQTHQAKKEINSYIRKSTIANLPGSDILRIKVFLPSFPEQQKIASFLSAVDEKIQQLSRKKELLEQYKKGVMQQLFSGKLRFKEENGKDYPDWEEKKLGEVLKIGSGKDYKHLDAGNIPVFGTGGYMLSVNKFLHSGETVFIGRKGTIDKPFYFEGDFWTVDTLFYTHTFKNTIPKFIYCVFQQIDWKLHNEASGVPSLSKSTIEKLKFDFPCIEEQQKIANFLSSIDAKIENTKDELEKVQTFKKGLLQKLFV